jgi:hypothetical protein
VINYYCLFVVAPTQKIRAFTWTVMDVAQCDPFVTQAQALFAEVLQHRELQTELYCQLIKQTSKHPAPTKTPGVQVVYFVKLFSACDPLIMNELN